MRSWVVIPTLNARELLLETLDSLTAQTVPVEVVVVDNASTDGTAEAVAASHPDVRVVRNARNLGFGAAINRVALELEGDVLVLVNNDVVCEPDFIAELLDPFGRPEVGMAAGVLLQADDPGRIDSAGIELDTTLRSWDYLWNEPTSLLESAADPVGPCGGAAAYRLAVFQQLGGFDETLFAYWEDVDLALRFREAGWRCALVARARALHRHGQTFGAASPAARRLEAFGRGYVLAKYRVGRRRPLLRARVALLDWPALAIHLLVRREVGPIRERLRARAAGLRAPEHRPPLELASIGFGTALRRQASSLSLRFRGELPAHFGAAGRAPTADRRGIRPTDPG